ATQTGSAEGIAGRRAEHGFDLPARVRVDATAPCGQGGRDRARTKWLTRVLAHAVGTRLRSLVSSAISSVFRWSGDARLGSGSGPAPHRLRVARCVGAGARAG